MALKSYTYAPLSTGIYAHHRPRAGVRLRLPRESRRLWVDAICINQLDPEEKSIQIPFMSEIYRNANAVLIWPGDHPEEAEFLKNIVLITRRLTSFVTSGAKNIPDEFQADMALLRSLLDLKWFTRRWIIQEAVLNPEVRVHCSGQTTSWARLARILTLANNVLPVPPHLKPMVDLWGIWVLGVETKIPCTIGRLLADFGSMKCSDDRDHVYALLGLANDVQVVSGLQDDGEMSWSLQGKLRFRVDYNMTAESVFTSIAKELLHVTPERKLEYIIAQADVRSGQKKLGELPSWVPDWRLPMVRKYFGGCLIGTPFPIEYNDKLSAIQIQPEYPLSYVIRAISEPFPTGDNPDCIFLWMRNTQYWIETEYKDGVSDNLDTLVWKLIKQTYQNALDLVFSTSSKTEESETCFEDRSWPSLNNTPGVGFTDFDMMRGRCIYICVLRNRHLLFTMTPKLLSD